jgi:murein L,D-transpeptidase YcbB/YkuD
MARDHNRRLRVHGVWRQLPLFLRNDVITCLLSEAVAVLAPPAHQRAHVRRLTPHTIKTGLLLVVAAFVATAFAGTAVRAQDDWLDGMPGFEMLQEKKELTVDERRQRNQLARDALRARVAPEFGEPEALLSQATVSSLQEAILRYQAIAASGGWPELPDKVTLRLNDSGDNVSILRRRLLITGDLPESNGRGWGYDGAVKEAVARFQFRHGLRTTGNVDGRTRRALNVPAAERLSQLRVNLARLKKLMKKKAAPRYVVVNVPGYQLEAMERGKLALRSNVVVGKPDRATPQLSAKIVEVNFLPHWRVPDSIARKDLIPQIRNDPDYFYREHFSVLPSWGAKPLDPSQINWSSPKMASYKFRQDPGPFNALGVVRINMPNKHVVYLHDTPLKQLFQQSTRAFSSGCVRVERVLDLAAWLLQDQPGWSRQHIDSVIASNASDNVRLSKAVPVHFIYVSAWAGRGGVAHFRQDIYDKDGLLKVARHESDQDAPVLTSITP